MVEWVGVVRHKIETYLEYEDEWDKREPKGIEAEMLVTEIALYSGYYYYRLIIAFLNSLQFESFRMKRFGQYEFIEEYWEENTLIEGAFKSAIWQFNPAIYIKISNLKWKTFYL